MKTVPVRVALCLGVSLVAGAGSATASWAFRPQAASAPIMVSVAGPAKLAVRNVHDYHASDGTLWFEGEIVNTGTADASAVAVLLSLYNRQGERLARGGALTISANVLPPGATGVWATDMDDTPATWARVHIELGEQNTADDYRAHNDTRVKAVGVTLGSDNPGYSEKVTGRVVNTGPATARVDEIIAAFYDKSGTLVRVADGGQLYPYATSQQVPAGGSAPFVVTANGYTGKPARVVVYVRAEKKPQPGGFEIG